MIRPRSRAFIFRHGPLSNALRAARTALSTSAFSPSATCAITSPVAGLIVSNVRPLVESTHLPSMCIFVCRIFTGRFFFMRDGAAVVVIRRLLRGRGWWDDVLVLIIAHLTSNFEQELLCRGAEPVGCLS